MMKPWTGESNLAVFVRGKTDAPVIDLYWTVPATLIKLRCALMYYEPVGPVVAMWSMYGPGAVRERDDAAWPWEALADMDELLTGDPLEQLVLLDKLRIESESIAARFAAILHRHVTESVPREATAKQFEDLRLSWAA